MPASTNSLHWSLDLTDCLRDTDYTVTIDNLNACNYNITSINLDARDEVLSTTLQIKFPSLAHFYDAWLITNPFAPGVLGVLKVEGITIFTGMATNFQPIYSANDRSVSVIFRDKMWATKDAVVDIVMKRKIKRAIVNLALFHNYSIFITDVDIGADTFTIDGNYTDKFKDLDTFQVYGSTANDGDWTCHGDATYSTVTHQTTIHVSGNITDATVDGAVQDVSFIYSSPDIGGVHSYPWAEDYIIPVWIKEPKLDGSAKSYRVFPNEFKTVYDLGAIVFNYSAVKIVSIDPPMDTFGDGSVLVATYATEIWAEIAYYDVADTSTQVDKILKAMFEHPDTDGGLAWVDGTDFTLEPTPQDVISKLEWKTMQGAGDAQGLISHLYDDPKIGFPQNYWIRDFMGQGLVEGRYVYQESALVFNGDMLLDPLDYPAGNWYDTATGTIASWDGTDWTWYAGYIEKDANGTVSLKQEINCKTATVYRVVFTISGWSVGSVTPSIGGIAGAAVSANGDYVQYIIAGAWSAIGDTLTRTLAFTPSNTSRFKIEDVSVSIVPKDVDIIYDASYPTPIEDLYTRAVLVNNEAAAINLTRGITPTDLMSGAHSTTETPDPSYTGAPTGTDCLTDGHGKSSWGYYKVGGKGEFDIDEPLPVDQPLFSIDLGAEEEIDRIIYSSFWTFTGDVDGQPWIPGAVNGLYMIYEPQRITVEGNSSLTAVPDAAGWYPLNEELYLAESTPGQGNGDWSAADAWKIVESIGKKTRHLRVIVNNPMFAKVGESNWSNQAYRIMIWFMSEFQVYAKNRCIGVGGSLPEVAFTNDPNDEYRYRFGLNNTLVDMYRPVLLAKLDATDDAGLKYGLKQKTLIIESNQIFNFQQRLSPDPHAVSIGYKYLVSRLDAASKEDGMTVSVDPRPDIRIGDTIYCSRLDPDKYYLVHGFALELTATTARQSLILENHDMTGQ